MITLARTLALIDAGTVPIGADPAAQLARLLIDSDQIVFRVGTRINEAHQDPALPMELGIRRNLLRELARVLRERWARAVTLRFV